jgi:hypothetical protein
MNRRKTLTAMTAVATTATLNLSGCAAIEPSSYAQEKPLLDLKTYFNGTIDAWGLFQDRSGKVIKRFTVLMRCTWNGNQGVLDEDFIYSDGTKQKRIWRLTETSPGKYIGKADDVIGEAVGTASGNALNWRYVLALPVDGKVYNVDFDDWMYLVDEKVMINRAVMSKFGFKLGEVLLSFTKR